MSIGKIGYEDTVEYRRVSLEALRISVAHRISTSDMKIANVSVEQVTDLMSGYLVTHLQARVASESLSSIKYPEDWKQAFKERWFPRWIIKRFPVKYTEYNAKVLYPDISIPEHQHYVHLTKYVPPTY